MLLQNQIHVIDVVETLASRESFLRVYNDLHGILFEMTAEGGDASTSTNAEEDDFDLEDER